MTTAQVIHLSDARAARGLPAPNVVSIEAVRLERYRHLSRRTVRHPSGCTGTVRALGIIGGCVHALVVSAPLRSAWLPAAELSASPGGGGGSGAAA